MKMKKEKNTKKLELIKSVMHAPPAMNIGKRGITDQIMVEIKNLLKRFRIIKLKFLKAILENNDLKDLTQEIILKSKSKLVEIRGHNIIISKN